MCKLLFEIDPTSQLITVKVNFLLNELKTLQDTLRQENSQELSEEKNTLTGEIARRGSDTGDA